MTIPSFRFLGASVLGLVLAAAAPTQGAVLVQYSFGAAGSETTAETGTPYAPTITLAGVNGTSVTDPAGTIGLEISSATPTPANAPFLRVDPQGASASAAEAVTNNKYFQFTISAPAADQTLSLDSLQFQVARGGAGTPRGYVVRSSLDNFANNLATAEVLTARPTYTEVAVPLGGAIADPVTFRIYSFSPGAGSSVDYDNIAVNGNVIPVPEPSSALLLGAAAVLVGARRRRA